MSSPRNHKKNNTEDANAIALASSSLSDDALKEMCESNKAIKGFCADNNIISTRLDNVEIKSRSGKSPVSPSSAKLVIRESPKETAVHYLASIDDEGFLDLIDSSAEAEKFVNSDAFLSIRKSNIKKEVEKSKDRVYVDIVGDVKKDAKTLSKYPHESVLLAASKDEWVNKVSKSPEYKYLRSSALSKTSKFETDEDLYNDKSASLNNLSRRSMSPVRSPIRSSRADFDRDTLASRRSMSPVRSPLRSSRADFDRDTFASRRSMSPVRSPLRSSRADFDMDTLESRRSMSPVRSRRQLSDAYLETRFHDKKSEEDEEVHFACRKINAKSRGIEWRGI
jgi:hypothetical protein